MERVGHRKEAKAIFGTGAEMRELLEHTVSVFNFPLGGWVFLERVEQNEEAEAIFGTSAEMRELLEYTVSV